jgi:hypothetical protein
MSFVRTKEIPPGSGNLYDYEVMGYRDNGRVRQKVIRYLGKHGTDHSHLLGGTVSPELRSVTVAPTPKPSTPLADTTRIPKMNALCLMASDE